MYRCSQRVERGEILLIPFAQTVPQIRHTQHAIVCIQGVALASALAWVREHTDGIESEVIALGKAAASTGQHSISFRHP